MAVSKIDDTVQTSEKMNKKSEKEKLDDKKAFIIAEEIKLAKILAGNNKTLRDKAIKRLKRWFLFRSQSTPFTENDFMRIWKGLFYAMWMSDKPLFQEECAEMISTLVHLTTVTYSLKFFKCGLQTLGNEWFGIDQLRLDKFLMFVRRFLRQGFVILKKNDWNIKIIKEFNNVLSATILNVDELPPIGLTMHFTEVYMEELAKISDGNIKPHLITELVHPFIKHLALLKDKRQITCVAKNIFRYLIRQSDMGLEFDEKFKAWKDAGFPGKSIDAMQREMLPDDEKMSDDEEFNQHLNDQKELDPRAGHVDVELPQLKFIPKQIISILNHNKFLDGSNTKSRKMISSLIDEFTQLSRGQYPLGTKRLDLSKKDGYSTKTKNAVNRLVKFENKLLNKNKKRKNQNEKDCAEPENKKKKQSSKVDDFSDELAEFIKKSEENITINDKKEKKVKRVLQNGFVAKDKKKKVIKEENNVKSKSNKKKLNSLVDVIHMKMALKKKLSDIKNMTKIDKEIKSKSLKKKHIKGVKKKIIEDMPIDDSFKCTFEKNSGTWFVYDEDIANSSILSNLNNSISEEANISTNNLTPITDSNTALQTSNRNTPNLINESPNQNIESTKPSNSMNFSETPTPEKIVLFQQNEWDTPSKEGETEIFVESNKYKKKLLRRNSDIIDNSTPRPTTPRPKTPRPTLLTRRCSLDSNLVKNPFSTIATPGGSASKKVKIALNLNKAQDIQEHVAQIKSSPGIPFDANKKPSKPLLKRHTVSPIDPFYKRKLYL